MPSINPNYVPPSFYDATGNLKPEAQAEAQAISDDVAARVQSMPPAQRDLFLATIQSLDIAPSAKFDQADLDKMLNRLQTATGTLSAITNDIIDFLARVMIEQASQNRKDALQNRLTARDIARGEIITQAGAMKDAAEKERAGAIASLVLTVVMSVVSIGMAGISAFKSGQIAKKMNDEIDVQSPLKDEKIDLDNAAKFDVENAQEAKALGELQKANQHDLDNSEKAMNGLRADQQFWGAGSAAAQSLGQVGGALSGAASSWADADAKEIEAKGKISEAEAQFQESQADISKEAQQALDDLIKAIINFVKELKEAKNELMRAVTQG